MTTAAQKAAANKAKAEAALAKAEAARQKEAARQAARDAAALAKSVARANAQGLRMQEEELGDYTEYKKNLAALDSLKQRTQRSAEKNIQQYSKRHTQDETQREIDRQNKLIQQYEDRYISYQTYANDRFGFNDTYPIEPGVKARSSPHKKELDFHMLQNYSRPKDINRVKQQFQTWNGRAPTEAEISGLAKRYGIDYTPPPPPPPPAPRPTFTPAPQYKPFQYAPPGANSWQTDYGAQPEGYTEADYRNPYYTLPKSFTDAHPFNPGGYSYLDESNPFMQKQLADMVKAGTYTYQNYQPYAQQQQQYQDVQQDRFQPDIYANNKKGGLIKAKTTKSTSKPTSKVKSSKASSRGDGIAQRGKTRGTMR